MSSRSAFDSCYVLFSDSRLKIPTSNNSRDYDPPVWNCSSNSLTCPNISELMFELFSKIAAKMLHRYFLLFKKNVEETPAHSKWLT